MLGFVVQDLAPLTSSKVIFCCGICNMALLTTILFYVFLSILNEFIMILQPHVDFGLKLLGADAMAIPGLYTFVQVGFLSFCEVMY